MFGFNGIGWPEMIIFLIIVLVLFGPSRLPQVSRAIGKSIRDFKKGLHDIQNDIETSDPGNTTISKDRTTPPTTGNSESSVPPGQNPAPRATPPSTGSDRPE